MIKFLGSASLARLLCYISIPLSASSFSAFSTSPCLEWTVWTSTPTSCCWWWRGSCTHATANRQWVHRFQYYCFHRKSLRSRDLWGKEHIAPGRPINGFDGEWKWNRAIAHDARGGGGGILDPVNSVKAKLHCCAISHRSEIQILLWYLWLRFPTYAMNQIFLLIYHGCNLLYY